MTHFTISLPEKIYRALRRRAASERKTPDALAAEWLSLQLDPAPPDEETLAFEEEIAAFERLLPDLTDHYDGQFVAVYQGQVVASGTGKLDVLSEVRARYGPVICYVEKVGAGAPRAVRVPSAWIVEA